MQVSKMSPTFERTALTQQILHLQGSIAMTSAPIITSKLVGADRWAKAQVARDHVYLHLDLSVGSDALRGGCVTYYYN